MHTHIEQTQRVTINLLICSGSTLTLLRAACECAYLRSGSAVDPSHPLLDALDADAEAAEAEAEAEAEDE